jgi:hypothetical protein
MGLGSFLRRELLVKTERSQISWPITYTPPKGKAENFHAWFMGTVGLLLEALKVEFTVYGLGNLGGDVNITDFVGQDVALCFPGQAQKWPKAYPAATVLHSIDECVVQLALWLTEAGIVAQPDREDPDCMTVFDAKKHYFLLDFMTL